MTCRIKAFGIAREIIGQQEYNLDLPENSRVGDLKVELYTRFPRLEALKSLFIAVNHEYKEDDALISGEDEVALIPPVAGG